MSRIELPMSLADRLAPVVFKPGLVICAVGVGVLYPKYGDDLRVAVTPIVVFLVYSSFRGIEPRDLSLSRAAVPILASLALSYGGLPVIGVTIARVLGDPQTILGLAVILTAPTTAGSAIVWTRAVGGNVQLTTLTAIISLIVAPVVVPLVLPVLVDYPVFIPVQSLLVRLALIVGAGVALVYVIPNDLGNSSQIDTLSTAAIVVLIYTSIAGSNLSEASVWLLGGIAMLAVALFVIGFLLSVGIGYFSSIDRESIIALFLSSNLKNLGISLLVAVSINVDNIALVIIAFYTIQQLLSSVFADTELLKHVVDQLTVFISDVIASYTE